MPTATQSEIRRVLETIGELAEEVPGVGEDGPTFDDLNDARDRKRWADGDENYHRAQETWRLAKMGLRELNA